MTSSRTRETAVLGALTAVITVLAAAGVRLGVSTPVEAAGVVTGAVCVWLTVRENVWNFPVTLATVSLFCVVFFQARLYADAGLQVVYFVLALIGWYLWLRGGEHHSRLRISRTSRTELLAVLAGGAALTLALWMTLRHAGGSASFFDALTTSISLCAQWLLNRKKVENWHFWIVADIIYIPLYAYKDLYLTAGLYAVFLVMATMGLLHWTAAWRAHEAAAAPAAPGPAGAVAA